MHKVHYSSKSNEWETPPDLYDILDKEFMFGLDATATNENALNSVYFTQFNNALVQDWSKFGSIFCNPPYGRLIGRFVEKGYQESLKGCTVVFLIPARTDTKWWHEYCSKGEVRFIKGRLKFQNRTFPSWRADLSHKVSPANFPSAIVIFRGKVSTEYVDYKKDKK